MVLKKLSKKIMAYTLTTAMMTGFFAVSNINLTTAWAATNVTSGVITIDDHDVTLAGDITIDGSTSAGSSTLNESYNLATGNYASITLNGSNHKIIVDSGQKITIAQNQTGALTFTNSSKKIDTGDGAGSLVINGPAEITANGITFGTDGNIETGSADNVITGAAITGGTVIGAKIAGGTITRTELANCTLADSVTVTLDRAVLTGTITGGGSAAIINGNASAVGLKLVGQASTSSNATITLTEGNCEVNHQFPTLTFAKGSNFTDKLEVTPAASGQNGVLFKVSNEDTFTDMMKNNKLVVKDATTGNKHANGFYGYVKDNTLTYTLLPFEFDKSGRKITATCVAKGCIYDGKTFDINVKEKASYAVRDNSSKYVGINLSDAAKNIKENAKNLWAAFESNYAESRTGVNAASTGTASFGLSGAVQATGTYTIDKKDISNAEINGLKKHGITSFVAGDSANNSNAKVAKMLPDDFVSIELIGTTTADTISASTAFTGALSSVGSITALKGSDVGTKLVGDTTPANNTVFLVYKTEEGALSVVDIGTVAGQAVSFSSTAGTNTVRVTPISSSNFTGTATITYKVVDEQVDIGTYNGSAQTPTISNAVRFSTNGTDFTEDAPSFTDAGEYEVYYKTSIDGDVKTAICTIDPAPVKAVWSATNPSYAYDGSAKTITVTRIDNDGGSLTQNNLNAFNPSGVKYTYKLADGTDVTSCTNVGEYRVTATLDASNKNFALTSAGNPANLTITPGNAVVTAKDKVAYCDGKAHTIDKVTINAPEASYKVLYGTVAGSCTSSVIPSFEEEGTYKIYYKVVDPDVTYTGLDAGNVNRNITTLTNGRSYVTLTIKPALTVKRSDSTAKSVTYTGKYFPITADAYCGTSKESDVKVVIYASKNSGAYTKVTNGIKDVGTYRFAYTLVIDGKEGSKVLMDDTVTIKAAAKKSIAKATTSVKNVTYNGKKQTAKVTVKYGSTTLKLNKDYTLKNATHINAGSFKVTITGKGNYTGTKTVIFKIAKRKVTKKVVIVKRNKKTFTVYVKIGKKNYKVAKTNYKLTAKYNKKTKKYAVTVAFKVNYSGAVKKTVK